MSGGSLQDLDSEPHGGAADLESTRTVAGGRPRADSAAQPADGAATETATPRTATEVVRHGPGLTVTAGQELTVTTGPHQDERTAGPAGPRALPPSLVRYGPGVPAAPPAGRAGLTAEHVWRDPRPAGPSRRLARLRHGSSGLALTAALLAASGVLLYLRFHHAPFQVTGCRDHPAGAERVRRRRDRAGHHQRLGRDGLLTSMAVHPGHAAPPHSRLLQSVASRRAAHRRRDRRGRGPGAGQRVAARHPAAPRPRSGGRVGNRDGQVPVSTCRRRATARLISY